MYNNYFCTLIIKDESSDSELEEILKISRASYISESAGLGENSKKWYGFEINRNNIITKWFNLGLGLRSNS